MKNLLPLWFVFGAMSVACSSGSSSSGGGGAYDALFDTPPSNATPDRLQGLWGGSADSSGVRLDLRVKIDDAQVTAAARCAFTDGTQLKVGASAAARIEQKPQGDISCFPLDPGGAPSECGDVQILQSQTDRQQSGQDWCAMDLQPQAYDYTMSGSKLRLTLNGQQVDMVKVSD